MTSISTLKKNHDKALAAVEAIRAEIADAESKVREASGVYDALRARLRSGDTSVTPADLAAGAKALEHAELLTEGIGARLREAEAERLRTATLLTRAEIEAEGLRGHVTVEERLAALAEKVTEELESIVAGNEDRRTYVGSLVERFHGLPVADQRTGKGDPGFGVVITAAGEKYNLRHGIDIDGVSMEQPEHISEATLRGRLENLLVNIAARKDA
ncbi:hypothetical protein [Brevibacterium samyangense]|uniref:Uncharacterized protein n=1 Tax=Brevibacterium samyangense TaxID=366888 RepID=A0ABN2THM3_9MICO